MERVQVASARVHRCLVRQRELSGEVAAAAALMAVVTVRVIVGVGWGGMSSLRRTSQQLHRDVICARCVIGEKHFSRSHDEGSRGREGFSRFRVVGLCTVKRGPVLKQ